MTENMGVPANTADVLLTKANNSYFEEKLFSQINEEEFEVKGAEFSNCTFKNCKLYNASFFDCVFEDCIFENCDLSSASIRYCSFRGVHFLETKLSGIQWSEAAIPLDVRFTNCLLNYSSFIAMDLRKIQFIECQLREVDFSEANLTHAAFNFSDFQGARFMNSNLTRANFSHALNYSIHPQGNTLCKTTFTLPEALSLLDVFDIIIE